MHLNARREAFDHLQHVLLEICASKDFNGQPLNRDLGPRPSELCVNEAIYRAAQYVHETEFISNCMTIFKCQSLGALTELFNLLSKHRADGALGPIDDVPALDSYLMLAGSSPTAEVPAEVSHTMMADPVNNGAPRGTCHVPECPNITQTGVFCVKHGGRDT